MLELPLSITLTWIHAAIRDHDIFSQHLDPVYAGLLKRIAQVTWEHVKPLQNVYVADMPKVPSDCY
jgi:hypothetical protein